MHKVNLQKAVYMISAHCRSVSMRLTVGSTAQWYDLRNGLTFNSISNNLLKILFSEIKK